MLSTHGVCSTAFSALELNKTPVAIGTLTNLLIGQHKSFSGNRAVIDCEFTSLKKVCFINLYVETLLLTCGYA